MLKLDDIIEKVTDACIASFGDYKVTDLMDSDKAKDMRQHILENIDLQVDMENACRKKDMQKLKTVNSLPLYSISELILHTNDFKLVSIAGSDAMPKLAMNAYDTQGKFSGIMKYVSTENTGGKNPFAAVCRQLNPNITRNAIADVVASVEAALSNSKKAYEYTATSNSNHRLIPCNNGIWDYDTKEFTPHDSPDRWTKYPDVVFTNKIDTDWNPLVQAPAFTQPDGTTWTVDGFIESLFDVDTVIGRASADIMWEILQFAIRGYNGKEGNMIYFCNASNRAKGQNGKTTFAEMLMFVIDHFSIPAYAMTHRASQDRFVNGQKIIVASIDKWPKDYILAGSIRDAMFVLSDENEEGTNYISGSGFLKNFSRGQSVMFNPKYEMPFNYACTRLKMHLQNETTKMNSTDDATFTHRIEVRYEKDFSAEGGGNPDVKNKYIIDERVAEYILWKITTQMPCLDDFSEDLKKTLKANVEDTKNDNIPTYRFLDEVLPGFNMNRIPAKWLYEMYDKSWRDQEGILKKITFQQFKKDLTQYLYNHKAEYEWSEKKTYFTAAEVDAEEKQRMQHPALLEYGLYEGHALSFIQGNTINGTYVAEKISKLAMMKQIASGIVIKK